MKRFFQKSLLLILLAFGGVHAAFAYDNADGYDGHFKLIDTQLSLDKHWISWRFPNYENDGIDEALKYSRFYVGGDAAGYNKWQTNPSHYFFYPLCQGAEILYLARTYGITMRQNEDYGVGDIKDATYRGAVRTSDVMFYPGEKMGPTQMANFFVRWTGWWDYNDNGSKNNKDYWMGQAKAGIGDPTDGARWQGPEIRHKGNGIERFYRITYSIPGTNTATFTRRAGKKIEVSISGNDHGSWNEYYGFGSGTNVNEYGYYTNNYGEASLSGGKATYTLNTTFDETESFTIYYHQFYKRSQTITKQSHGTAESDQTKTVKQHFQANRISVVVKGFMYPSNLAISQDKWKNTATLKWTINNKDTNHNTDGGWLVFRRKDGETGYELLTSSRLNNGTSSFTDTNRETGATYTYWVTFAPNSYGTMTEPILNSKLTVSGTNTHDNVFRFADMNADLNDGENGGIKLSWNPEKTGSDVTFFIQRWDEVSGQWLNLKDVGQTSTTYTDTDVLSWKEYKYRIKTSYWDLDFYSEEKTITYALMTKVKEFTASQGTYSNMVKLNWNVTVLSEGDTRFVVYRKLLGDAQAVFAKIYETVGTESAFYYEDMSAQPGQFYDYKVTAFAYVPANETTKARWAEGNSLESDGFVQTRGLLSGRIKYGTGTAVANVKVLLTKSGDNDNTAKQFYSFYLAGENTSGVQWQPSGEMIENYLAGSNRPWTIQLYVHPDAGMTGTQSIFDVNGYAGVGVSPAAGGYELMVKSATGSNAASYSATGIIIPAAEYTHLVFSYDGASTYTLRAVRPTDEYENGVAFEEGKTLKTFTGKANVKFEDTNRSRTVTFGKSGFKGNIDEMRVWTKVLTDKEVNTYYNRTLTCTEKNLLAYWPVDEGISGMKNVYDYSKTNGVANSNHALIQGNVAISEVVPTEEQLSIYSYTDENGNYVIRGVPFSGDGTTYLVRPVMGIHEFNPTYHTRYVSSNTLTHDNVEFEDVSSFKVTGVVYYENTTYPVQGCNFSVDGNLCSKEGKLIETDEQGRFEISVPIGDHYINITKNGHTFVAEGRYPAGVGTMFTFDREVSNLTFYDNTLVSVVGRVVGGDIEGNKSVGFGESTNNIGVTELVLTPTNDLYSLNVVNVTEGLTSRYENNKEKLACASTTSNINSTSWRGANDLSGKIFIQTDAKTGEFSALVPPLVYNVSAPVVVETKKTVGEAGLVDLSNPNVTATDTTSVINEETGTEATLEFEYNSKYMVVYHSEPSFTVTQADFNNGAFGSDVIDITDQRGTFTVNIVNKEGAPNYTYGKPIFIQGNPYTFKLKGYEQYVNEDGDEEPITTTVPLKDCVVTISNALSDGQSVLVKVEENNEKGYTAGDVVDLEENQILLDENGEADYTWKAGYPNITHPYSRNISMTYEIGGKVYEWTIDDKNYIEGVILGSIPTGSNFVTAGPDKLLMILRDPPGSNSSAEWSSGTVTTKEKTIGHQWSSETTIKDTWEFGVKAVTFHGIGTGIITSTDTKDEFTAGAKVVTEGENATTVSHSLTITETVATSDDPSMVGSMADVYVGYSSNLLFGKAREVNFLRDENGNIDLGVDEIVSVGSQFSTKFSYTGYYIESYLIPNLMQVRNSKLLTVTPEEYANYQNTTDELIYITMLSPDDERFGSDNNDREIWGDQATAVDAIEGPSYKIVLPARLAEEGVLDDEIGKELKADQDEIRWANMQISNWIKYLAQNEEEKVKAWEDRDGEISVKELGDEKDVPRLINNYSLDGGTSITYSLETESTTTETHEHETGALAILGNKFGAKFNETGFTAEVETETGGKRHKNTSDGTSNTASFSFTLSEGGDDALTIDAYRSASYSPMFRTRGGQTSAPYEDEEYTKYFEPGKHKLHEKTMQIEVPDIEVEVPVVSNITSGTAASYTLLLTNKSEIDCDLYYKLLQMDETNPNGAQLSIDGVALSDNRVIKVPAGEVVRKTLLLKQSNLGVLDYERIGIVLASQEQGDPTGTFPQIADTVYISAYYVPSSSPVKMELNRTLLNTSSGANLDITFNSFDRNYYNLKAFRIQYMKQGDTDWTTLKEYLVNVEEGQQLSSLQAQLPNAADVNYTLDMSSFADGKYTFRVLSASTYGTGEATLVTDAIEVVKDMSRPMAFGTPKPTTGFLGVGDDIELTFNEDINNGRLTSTGNFIVTAALNGQQVAHDVALKAAGGEDAVAMTDANYNFIGKGFAADMWIRIDAEPTEEWDVYRGTFFSHGNGGNKIELGIVETQIWVDKKWQTAYKLAVNGVDAGHAKYIPAGKWVYIAFSLDPEGYTGYGPENARPAYSALMATDDQTVILAKNTEVYPIGDETGISYEKYEGNGRIAIGGKGFTGAIHEVALWDEAIDVNNLQAQMYETKKPSTEHLIGYWKFNEGRGTQAQDLARNRHMTIKNTAWYLNNQNKALDLANDALYADNDAVAIYLAECPARNNDDYAVEMWFRAEKEQDDEVVYLFDTDAFGAALENGKMVLYATQDDKTIMSMGNKQYNDANWHHFAMNVLRSGNAIVYIDGEAMGQVASTNVPALQTSYMYLGANRVASNDTITPYNLINKLNGQIDEIRVWNATLNAKVLRERMYSRLYGTEPGLAAYYPFEEEKLDANMQIVTEGSALDMVTKRHKATGFKNSLHAIACNDEAPALKPVNKESNVNYSFVSSERGIVINLDEDANRIEGVTVNVTVKDVLDLNGNQSLPITWTALVKRNQLLWFEDELNVVGNIGEEKKFTAMITNQSAQTEYWVLNDLPAWLSANFTSGSLPALGNQEITFTVDASAPTGKSQFSVYVSGNNAILVPLTVNMNLKSEAPNWTVTPSDYEGMATLMGAVMINMSEEEYGSEMNNVYSEDEDDLVGAFIDDKCVGVTNVQYDSYSDSYRVFLNIYGNPEDDGKEITLKVWDASTGIVHPFVYTYIPEYEDEYIDYGWSEGTKLEFAADATWGDFDLPCVVYATNYIQQSTSLNKNWNWISIYAQNINPEDKSYDSEINSVLKSIGNNGKMLKNQGSFSEYDAEFGWYYEETGTDEWDEPTYAGIPEVQTGQMYKLQMESADTLVIAGPACSQYTNIIIKEQGWSWIPYIRSFSLSLDDAFANIEPQRNDQVKGQNGFAMYNGTAWTGTLKALNPGKGYIYRNTTDDEKDLRYPETRPVATTAAFAPARKLERTSMFDAIDPTMYESNMTVLAIVKDGDNLVSNAQEIAVFDGAKCLASAMKQEDGFFYLTIPGDKTISNQLRMYVVVNDEVLETSTQIAFNEDATLGDLDNPFVVTLGYATAIGQMLTTNNYSLLRVVDVSGRIVYSGIPSDFDKEGLNDGVYIFELVTPDGQSVHYKQLIQE